MCALALFHFFLYIHFFFRRSFVFFNVPRAHVTHTKIYNDFLLYIYRKKSIERIINHFPKSFARRKLLRARAVNLGLCHIRSIFKLYTLYGCMQYIEIYYIFYYIHQRCKRIRKWLSMRIASAPKIYVYVQSMRIECFCRKHPQQTDTARRRHFAHQYSFQVHQSIRICQRDVRWRCCCCCSALPYTSSIRPALSARC